MGDVEALAPGTMDRLLFWFTHGKKGHVWGGDSDTSSSESGSSSPRSGHSSGGGKRRSDRHYGRYYDVDVAIQAIQKAFVSWQGLWRAHHPKAFDRDLFASAPDLVTGDDLVKSDLQTR